MCIILQLVHLSFELLGQGLVTSVDLLTPPVLVWLASRPPLYFQLFLIAIVDGLLWHSSKLSRLVLDSVLATLAQCQLLPLIVIIGKTRGQIEHDASSVQPITV